jgi:hypothetical protein
VLSLVPLKCLVLSARVVSSEPRPQSPSLESLPSRAEEELVVVAAVEASITPPPPVPAAAVEEGETAAEATAPHAALEPPAEAIASGGDVVLLLDKDSIPPPLSGSHDVVMTPAPEPTPAVAATDSHPATEVLDPSPVAEAGPFATTEAAETSSAWGTVTVEEVMELATCRYIDYPGVGIIDLEAPKLPKKVLEVATERLFAEPSIMETITSMSKAQHEYERAGGFAPSAAAEAAETALEAPTACTESAAGASAPPPTSEDRVASLPQPVEASETVAAVVASGAVEVVDREAGSSPPHPIAAGVVEVRVPHGPAAAVQERVAPEETTRTASPKIQEAEEMGASLSQGVAGVEAQALELACTLWAATSGFGTTPRMTRTLRRATPWSAG